MRAVAVDVKGDTRRKHESFHTGVQTPATQNAERCRLKSGSASRSPVQKSESIWRDHEPDPKPDRQRNQERVRLAGSGHMMFNSLERVTTSEDRQSIELLLRALSCKHSLCSPHTLILSFPCYSAGCPGSALLWVGFQPHMSRGLSWLTWQVFQDPYLHKLPLLPLTCNPQELWGQRQVNKLVHLYADKYGKSPPWKWVLRQKWKSGLPINETVTWNFGFLCLLRDIYLVINVFSFILLFANALSVTQISKEEWFSCCKWLSILPFWLLCWS